MLSNKLNNDNKVLIKREPLVLQELVQIPTLPLLDAKSGLLQLPNDSIHTNTCFQSLATSRSVARVAVTPLPPAPPSGLRPVLSHSGGPVFAVLPVSPFDGIRTPDTSLHSGGLARIPFSVFKTGASLPVFTRGRLVCVRVLDGRGGGEVA